MSPERYMWVSNEFDRRDNAKTDLIQEFVTLPIFLILTDDDAVREKESSNS